MEWSWTLLFCTVVQTQVKFVVSNEICDSFYFVIHRRLKKHKTCGSKHIRILEGDPVKSARHVSHHFIGQKDGGVQARSHSSPSNFLKSICLHYREFSVWKLLNTKQGLLRALCRTQGLVVWPWVCQQLQIFHADVCACRREVHVLVTDRTSAHLWVMDLWSLKPT